jgi:CheY-like chemotaxis protein
MPEQTILVIDDEMTILSVAQMALARYGYQVILAQSGAEALKLMEVWADMRIRLAIIDVFMPVMDGMELADRVREMNPDLPIIFTSGLSEQENLRPEKTRGVPYLAKPFAPIELVAKVREVLEAKRSSLGKMG